VTDTDALDERLRAVERAVADGDADAELAQPRDELTERVDDLSERVAELDAGLQAVRGYVGEVRSADEAIESRADAALATVERLEERVERLERRDAPSDDADDEAAAAGERDDDGVSEREDADPRDHDGRREHAEERDGPDRNRTDAAPADSHRRRVDRKREPTESRRPTGGDAGGCGGRYVGDGIDRRRPETPAGGPRRPPHGGRCPHCASSHSGRGETSAGEYTGERDAEAATEAVDEQGLVARLRSVL
jgi:polyhydroxyalkanoate synthesis regulator phasin